MGLVTSGSAALEAGNVDCTLAGTVAVAVAGTVAVAAECSAESAEHVSHCYTNKLEAANLTTAATPPHHRSQDWRGLPEHHDYKEQGR